MATFPFSDLLKSLTDGTKALKNRLVDTDGNDFGTETNPVNMKQTRRNVSTIETIINAESVAASDGQSPHKQILTEGADEVYLLINIDKQPWGAICEFGPWSSTPSYISLYPKRENVTSVAGDTKRPYQSLLVFGDESGDGTWQPTSKLEAIDRARTDDVDDFYIVNSSAEIATVTAKVLRIWR